MILLSRDRAIIEPTSLNFISFVLRFHISSENLSIISSLLQLNYREGRQLVRSTELFVGDLISILNIWKLCDYTSFKPSRGLTLNNLMVVILCEFLFWSCRVIKSLLVFFSYCDINFSLRSSTPELFF